MTKPSVCVGIGDDQPVEGGLVADGRLKERSPAFVKLEGRPHRLHEDEDIREQNGRIHAEDIDGLQSHLDTELRGFAELEEGDLAPDLLVFRQVASRLAHHPDRGIVGLFTAACFEKGIVHNGSVRVKFR